MKQSASLETGVEVTLWRGFREDRRVSMDIYADSLAQALSSSGVVARQASFTPQYPRRVGRDAWSRRYARFVSYPIQASRAKPGIHHIVDHGYGHLVYVLPRDRTVVTVHDVIPLVRWFGRLPTVARGRRPWLNLLSASGLRWAAHLIAISDHTRQDLIQYCRCRPERITVIYYGIEACFRVFSPVERAQARQKWSIPDDGTLRVLMVGSAFYKNHDTAVRALLRVMATAERKVELIRVGTDGEAWQAASLDGYLRAGVRRIPSVRHEEMPEIYNCVDVLFFPSLYEGFGRPPIEAMACGTPVVASNGGALREIVEDAALISNPTDHLGHSEHLRMALFDRDVREALTMRGLIRARRFSWQSAARSTADVYAHVCRNLGISGRTPAETRQELELRVPAQTAERVGQASEKQ